MLLKCIHGTESFGLGTLFVGTVTHEFLVLGAGESDRLAVVSVERHGLGTFPGVSIVSIFVVKLETAVTASKTHDVGYDLHRSVSRRRGAPLMTLLTI